MSFARAAFGSIGSTLVGNAILLVTGVLTARVLGPAGKGTYVLAFLIPGLAVNLLVLGLGNAGAYFIARGRCSAATALGTSLAIVLPLGGAATLGVLLFLRATGGPAEGGTGLAIASWSIAPTLGYAVIRHAALGLRDHLRFSLLNVLDKIALAAFIVGVTLAGTASVTAYCVAGTLAACAAFGLALAAIAPRLGGRLRFDRVYAREALHYGLRGHLGWFAELLNYRLDMILVHTLAGAGALGLYSVSVSLAETLWIVPGCVGLVLMPKLAGDAPETTASTTAITCRVVSGLSIVAAGAMAAAGGVLLRGLYGEGFRDSLQPLLLLLPGVAALALVKVLSADFAARGRPGLVSAVSWVSLGLTFVLDVALIPRAGAAGAALASSIAYVATTVMMVLLYRRLTGVAPAALLFPGRADARQVRRAMRGLLPATFAAGGAPRP